MADTVTVHRNFKPGEILVEVVSVGLYGLTAAEVPIAPIAGLEASTVQGALEGINGGLGVKGNWKPTVKGSTTAGTTVLKLNSAKYTIIRNIVTCSVNFDLVSTIGGAGDFVIEGLPIAGIDGFRCLVSSLFNGAKYVPGDVASMTSGVNNKAVIFIDNVTLKMEEIKSDFRLRAVFTYIMYE